jgi:hypothetical protein
VIFYVPVPVLYYRYVPVPNSVHHGYLKIEDKFFSFSDRNNTSAYHVLAVWYTDTNSDIAKMREGGGAGLAILFPKEPVSSFLSLDSFYSVFLFRLRRQLCTTL